MLIQTYIQTYICIHVIITRPVLTLRLYNKAYIDKAYTTRRVFATKCAATIITLLKLVILRPNYAGFFDDWRGALVGHSNKRNPSPAAFYVYFVYLIYLFILLTCFVYSFCLFILFIYLYIVKYILSIVKSTGIRFWLHLSDWFCTKQSSVWRIIIW